MDVAEVAAMSYREKARLEVSYYNAKKLNEYGENHTLKEGYREFVLVNSSSKNFSGIPVNLTHSTVHVPTNVFDKCEFDIIIAAVSYSSYMLNRLA